MKNKPSKLIHSLVLIAFAASMTACLSNPETTSEYHIINQSGHPLTLYKYIINDKDTVEINNNAEYTYSLYGMFEVEPFGGGNMYDSVTILFDDNKKLTYTRSGREERNILHMSSYKMTEIDTHKDRYYHYVFKYYITPDDYELAE